MFPVDSKTFLGNRTEFIKISPNKPYIGMQNSKQISSPDRDKLKIINTNPSEEVQGKYRPLVNRINQTLKTSETDKNYQLQKSLKTKNYFTDFWITKDNEENSRFIFSFDTRSYLQDNALFPVAYISGLFQDDQILDTKHNLDNNVLSVNVYRSSLSETGFQPKNELGTVEKGSQNNRLNMRIDTSKRPVEEIERVSLKLLNGSFVDSEQSVSFFEGCDKFSSEDIKDTQHSAIYNYSVECDVLDGSSEIMRAVAHRLVDLKRRIGELHSYIAADSSRLFGNVPAYNLQTGRLNKPLDALTTLGGENAQQEIVNVLRSYQGILNRLAGSTIDLVSYYQNKIMGDMGLIELSLLKEMERSIDFGIKFVYDKLLKVYPL
jgi:hypothetical protein